MSEPKYHAREVAALLYDRDAEIAKLQAELKNANFVIDEKDKMLDKRTDHYQSRIDKLQAEVKLQSDSADHWEDEAMNHMSQAAKLKAELQRHKFAIGILYKCFREKEPTPSAWVDEAFALKEVRYED